jgi:hypothetical protein
MSPNFSVRSVELVNGELDTSSITWLRLQSSAMGSLFPKLRVATAELVNGNLRARAAELVNGKPVI